MVDRVLALFAPALQPRGAILVDATLGRAGHARALLAAHPGLALIGVDTDTQAIEESRRLLAPYADRVTLVHGRYDADPRDAVHAGAACGSRASCSTWAYPPRSSTIRPAGFAYSYDAPLDMRMDQSRPLTAADVREHLPGRPAGPGAARLRGGAVRPADRRRRGAGPGPRSTSLHRAAGRDRPGLDSGPGPANRWQPRQADVPGAADRGQRRTRRAARGAAGAPWTRLAVGGRIVVLAYHSLEDRAVKTVLAEAAADRTPPGLPVPLDVGPAHVPAAHPRRAAANCRGTGGKPAGRLGPTAGRRADQGGGMSSGPRQRAAPPTGLRSAERGTSDERRGKLGGFQRPGGANKHRAGVPQ